MILNIIFCIITISVLYITLFTVYKKSKKMKIYSAILLIISNFGFNINNHANLSQYLLSCSVTILIIISTVFYFSE